MKRILMIVTLLTHFSAWAGVCPDTPPNISVPPAPNGGVNGQPCSNWKGRFDAVMASASSCFDVNCVPQYISIPSVKCIDAEGAEVMLPYYQIKCI